MPPKKAGGAKKKKKVEAPPPFPIPRDFSESAPIDAAGGALGLDSAAVQARVKVVQQELVLFRIADALREGDLDLELADCGLDELPEEIFDLPWLQVLDASKNAFVNDVFEELRLLPALKALDLSTNLLHGTLPASIGDLPPGIEEISIDGNVVAAIPDAAARLRQLTWFSAKRNLLVEFPASCLAAWVNLEYLDLRNNKLKTLPDEVGACAQLRVLLLSNNEMKELPASLGACKELRVLHASRNSLAALPESLGSLSLLEELDVSFNKLAGLPETAVVGMRALKTLLAASNKIDALPPAVGALTELEVISFSANNIKSLPEELGGLAKLREAYFNGNPISSLPASLAGWTALEEGGFKASKLKGLPEEVGAGWKAASTIDLRGKKKDTCKVPPEVLDQLRRVHVLGAIPAKSKKKGGKKKK